MRQNPTAIAKQSTRTLIVVGILFLVSMGAQAQPNKFHDSDKLFSFASTDDIDWHFSSVNISFERLQLTNFVASNYVMACYPYSGADTIDVYVFVKHGTMWRIQTVHYALNPTNRHLHVKEPGDRIEVLDGSRQLIGILAFVPHKQKESNKANTVIQSP